MHYHLASLGNIFGVDFALGIVPLLCMFNSTESCIPDCFLVTWRLAGPGRRGANLTCRLMYVGVHRN